MVSYHSNRKGRCQPLICSSIYLCVYAFIPPSFIQPCIQPCFYASIHKHIPSTWHKLVPCTMSGTLAMLHWTCCFHLQEFQERGGQIPEATSSREGVQCWVGALRAPRGDNVREMEKRKEGRGVQGQQEWPSWERELCSKPWVHETRRVTSEHLWGKWWEAAEESGSQI